MYFSHVIEVLTKKIKITKRAEIQARISALNFLYNENVYRTTIKIVLLIIRDKTTLKGQVLITIHIA